MMIYYSLKLDIHEETTTQPEEHPRHEKELQENHNDINSTGDSVILTGYRTKQNMDDLMKNNEP